MLPLVYRTAAIAITLALLTGCATAPTAADMNTAEALCELRGAPSAACVQIMAQGIADARRQRTADVIAGMGRGMQKAGAAKAYQPWPMPTQTCATISGAMVPCGGGY